jgi:hypothetical protein
MTHPLTAADNYKMYYNGYRDRVGKTREQSRNFSRLDACLGSSILPGTPDLADEW